MIHILNACVAHSSALADLRSIPATAFLPHHQHRYVDPVAKRSIQFAALQDLAGWPAALYNSMTMTTWL